LRRRGAVNSANYRINQLINSYGSVSECSLGAVWREAGAGTARHTLARGRWRGAGGAVAAPLRDPDAPLTLERHHGTPRAVSQRI
jgi:hypothetical protein